LRQQIEDVLREKFGIGHTTVQTECTPCNNGDLFCKMTVVDKNQCHE
jgi:hypothetical protein